MAGRLICLAGALFFFNFYYILGQGYYGCEEYYKYEDVGHMLMPKETV